MYNTSVPEQIAHMFTNAGNRIVITEQVFLEAVRGAGVDLEHVVVVDGPVAGALSLADLEANPAADFDFEAAWRAVRPDDLATLIYTAGTTGPSKGVEITHANIVAQIAGLDIVLPVGPDDRTVSYLPSAHVADRMSAHGVNLFTGATVTCVPDAREIAAALSDVRPTTLFGVPRVWQKLKAGIEAKLAVEPNPVNKALANWAIGVDARPYIGALIVLDPDTAAIRAKALGMPDADLARLAAHPEIVQEIRAVIESGNTKLARGEQIKRFRIVPAAWEPGGDEITPTLELRRAPIAQKYATEIAELYQNPSADPVVDLK